MRGNYPQAYFVSWGTYGIRLHGSSKPHVDRDHNEYGAPFAPTDPNRKRAARERMGGDPIRLTLEQRKVVEDAIRDVCARYGWTIHSLAVQTDHTHVVLTAFRDGEALREALKAVASRTLNKQFGKRRWWAEGGSTKYLWERSYFKNSTSYVQRQRDF